MAEGESEAHYALTNIRQRLKLMCSEKEHCVGIASAEKTRPMLNVELVIEGPV